MKKLPLLSLLVAVLVVCAATAAQAAKIEICHFPPGNPGNLQTITINDTALPAHQAHGDLVGSCSANCETICDDGNKCTVDVVPNNTQCQCQAQPRPAVDCSDELACTTDSCDPAQGCQYTAVVCPVPDLCTVMCSEPGGSCETTPVVCPTGQACNPSTGACETTVFTWEVSTDGGSTWSFVLLPNTNFGCTFCTRLYRTFVNGVPSAVSFRFASDNEARMFVNGTVVFADYYITGVDWCTAAPCCSQCCDNPSNCNNVLSVQTPFTLSATELSNFVLGTNEIRWQVNQQSGGSGFATEMTVSY